MLRTTHALDSLALLRLLVSPPLAADRAKGDAGIKEARDAHPVVMAGTALCNARLQAVRQHEDGKHITRVIKKACRKHAPGWAERPGSIPQQTTVPQKILALGQ